MKQKSIEEALNEHTGKWMEIPGVIGTGQGVYKGAPCIKIFVTKLTVELKQQIPGSIENYPVIIEETGMFKAFS